jgi:hypothetical protein
MNSSGNNNDLSNYLWSPTIQNHQQMHQIQSSEDHLISQLEDLQQQQQKQHKQKKKSRGNRKMQRYCRKLRKQGIDSDTITKLISSSVVMEQTKTAEVIQQNQQTIKPTVNETTFHAPESIMKKNDKKKKQKKTKEKQTIIKKKNESSSRPVSSREVKASPKINDSIDYTKVPDEIFCRMTSTAFNRSEKLNNIFNEDEKIKFIRGYTSLIDRLSYVQLQEFQWKYYHHIGVTQNIWKGRVSKHLAEKYSVCHTYGRSKTLIGQRLKQIEQHLQQTQDRIEQFEQEILSKCTHSNDCCTAMKELSSIIHQFVQGKQQPLQREFKYKREMLILDATDHQLIQKFFDLKPNKSHVSRYFVTYIFIPW